MAPSHPKIAQEIRLARLRAGLTQEEAASLIGVTRFQWIKWEQGLHKPLEERQGALARELGVDPEVFRDDAKLAGRLYAAIRDVIDEMVV